MPSQFIISVGSYLQNSNMVSQKMKKNRFCTQLFPSAAQYLRVHYDAAFRTVLI